ncbi:Glycerate dehydrogenase [gamma proteobacterium HdN1]|nr:Glycerate dehydrogenase [gamma proteobacterium HdN1]
MKSVFLDRASMGDGIHLDRLRAAAPALTEYDYTAPEQVAERIADHDIAITNKSRICAETMARCKQLKLIAVTATGLNNIDMEAAHRHGIQVANVQHYATPSIVQHTFSLMLALTTRLVDYHNDVRSGEWARSSNFCLLHHPIRELSGKTLGIVGHGDLGQGVARAASAFGMHVKIAARPGAHYSTDTPAVLESTDSQVERIPLMQLLPQVDVLSLHCLLSPATERLIGAPQLRLMRRDSLLINTARGGLIDEQALADALRERRIGGAGLDVLSEEPPTHPNPLLSGDLPNLIITPHCAWGSCEARQRLLDHTANNIRDFLAGR